MLSPCHQVASDEHNLWKLTGDQSVNNRVDYITRKTEDRMSIKKEWGKKGSNFEKMEEKKAM